MGRHPTLTRKQMEEQLNYAFHKLDKLDKQIKAQKARVGFSTAKYHGAYLYSALIEAAAVVTDLLNKLEEYD